MVGGNRIFTRSENVRGKLWGRTFMTKKTPPITMELNFEEGFDGIWCKITVGGSP